MKIWAKTEEFSEGKYLVSLDVIVATNSWQALCWPISPLQHGRLPHAWSKAQSLDPLSWRRSRPARGRPERFIALVSSPSCPYRAGHRRG